VTKKELYLFKFSARGVAKSRARSPEVVGKVGKGVGKREGEKGGKGAEKGDSLNCVNLMNEAGVV
jgi:hypothetical protein